MEWRRAQREWINVSLRLACSDAITKATTSPPEHAMTERAPKKRRWKALALANGVTLDCCTMEKVKKDIEHDPLGMHLCP